jgi:Cof subfamily protein (haloacid dehalogenase superfamily)
MSQWKLIALDLDGTLLNRQGEVSELNREWLKRAEAQGVVVTLVSGRHVSKVMPIARELGLTAPFITSNGCEMWTSEERLIERTCLSAEQADWIHRWAEANRLSYRAYRADGVHDWEPKEGGSRAGDAWLKVLLKRKVVERMNPASTDMANLQREAEASDLFEVIGYSGESGGGIAAIDLHPRGVSKAAALSQLCTRLGIAPKQVIAFGDDANDIEMLRWAGKGVAMENAPVYVRKAADQIAPHHDRDGVARLLRELL